MGFEGAGEIVEVGEGVDPTNVGKKVAFFESCTDPNYTGTWRQSKVANFSGLVQYPNSADYNKICSSFVNPLTVCGFVDTIQKKGQTAAIQDAAQSALGR